MEIRIKKTIHATLLAKHFLRDNKLSDDVKEWFGIDPEDTPEDQLCQEEELSIQLDGWYRGGGFEVDIDTTDKSFPDSMWEQLDEIARENYYWFDSTADMQC